MSAKYELLKALVKKSGLKHSWDLSADEIIAVKKKQNAKITIPGISDKDLEISRIYVMGCPVVTMKHRKKSGHANLFIIGGGMVSAPRPGSIKKAVKFAKETGLDMYIPYYPLCTNVPISRSYQMIYETYREMLKDYAPENISALGTSSGGNLALGLAAYIHQQGDEVPMPGHILAISPGTCPATEEEWQRMLELDKKDVIIPASYMKTAETIMRHGDENVPDYMIHLQTADFTGCPKVTFMYGSDETLYGAAPSFEAAMKKYGVDYEMIVGEGMFHCYPVFPICEEAKEGWDQMVSLMKVPAGGKSKGMKFKPAIWIMMTSRIRKGLKAYWPEDDVDRLIRSAKPIYKDLLSKVEGVSDDNPMASNITMAFVIIAIWLASGTKLTPEDMGGVMDIALDWPLMRKYFGTIDMNTEKGIKAFGKMMHKDADWAAKHPEDWNTWDFNFDEQLHKDGFYYHFTHCPIADFCKKYGYEEINPVLCNLDFTTMSMMHSVLHREHTVAEGGGICDYWTVGDKVADPE